MGVSFIRISSIVLTIGTVSLGVIPPLFYHYREKATHEMIREKNINYFLSASLASVEQFLSDILEDLKTVPLMFDSSKGLMEQKDSLFFYMMTLLGKNSCIEGFNFILDRNEAPVIVEIIQEKSPTDQISYRVNIFHYDKKKTTIYEILYNEKGVKKQQNSYQIDKENLGSLAAYKAGLSFVGTPLIKNLYNKMKENTSILWSEPVTEFFGQEFLLVGSPIRDSKGLFIGSIFARIDFNCFVKTINRLLPVSPFLKFLLIDKKEKIIFHTDNKKIFLNNSKGQRVVRSLSSIEDSKLNTAYKIYENSNMSAKFSKFHKEEQKSFHFVEISQPLKTDWVLGCIYSQKNQDPEKNILFQKQFILIFSIVFLFLCTMVSLFWVLHHFLKNTSQTLKMIKENKTPPKAESYFKDFEKINKDIVPLNRATTMFHRLVPSAFIPVVFEQDTPELVSERKKLTILYFLEKNFFEFANRLTPEQLSEIFSKSIQSFSTIIEKDGGHIDQYMNGALQASYTEEGDELSACQGALSCLAYLEKSMNPSFQKMGFGSLDVRFGLASGHGVLGYVGSEKHLEYSVLGACASIAKKLAQINKEFGTRILVDDHIYHTVNQKYIIRPVDRVKSNTSTFLIYELMGKYGENNAGIDLGYIAMKTQQAWEKYDSKKWDAAKKLYQEILNEFPYDPVALHFVDRCSSLLNNPPDNAWDGVVYEV